ncbi:MAG: hypothetical protein LBU27_01800 [Candidatus Peribacteria bacterium]|nr:hypothetical protein [Candidatus Peribacteria bacterium]
MDQAKEIIGKTVELEFKLPNENTDGTGRLALAEKLYQDVLANPEKMAELADNRASENVFYTLYTGATLTQLPPIYQQNLSLLTTLATGQLSQILEGTYGNAQTYDENGEPTMEELKGYTFFRILDQQTGERTTAGIQDLVEVATQLKLPYSETLDIQLSDEGIASGTYKIIDGTLKYNNGELYTNQEAYQVRVLTMLPNSIIGLTSGQIAEQDATFNQRVAEIKADLAKNPSAQYDDATEIANGMVGLLELKQAIPNFDATLTDAIQSYTTEGGFTYLLHITDRKAPTDKRFALFTINNVNEDSFVQALKSMTVYTVQEVFVQDHLSWVTAQSSDSKILNGANFKYASPDKSQIGQTVVVLHFDEVGKEIFCDITSHYIGKQMAIFIGGQIITAPTIQSKICDGSAQIDGQFTPESAKELTTSLNDGALPAPLILMQEEKVSPSLGDSAFSGAIIAMIVGLLLIYVYMTIVYGVKK